mgnify:CR=1 FL=1|tara:strand:- start:5404 stop:6255 length:852 start_codon:yes stop_codon:yes gene_type:complete
MTDTFAAETWVDRSKQLLNQAQEHVYKETDDGLALKAYVFSPPGEPDQLRPVVMFFSSGSWDNILISQFGPQCMHFVGRGAITILVEYRTSSTHGTSPMEAVSDARSAIRWVRYNAEILQIDPTRIVVGGGSAGGHLALAAAMIPGVADDPNDPNITCVPNGLILYCPIVDTSKKGCGFERFRNADDANRANPSKYIGKHMPPMIIFHGTADKFMSVDIVAKFAKQVQRKSNVCEMVMFDGRDNTFYNFNVDPDAYDATLMEADRFLVDQGFLPAPEDDGVVG